MTEPAGGVLSCRQCALRLEEYEAQCCSRCKLAIYCNVECQRAHWKEHKPHCNTAVAPKPTSAPCCLAVDVMANDPRSIEPTDTTEPQSGVDHVQATIEQCLVNIHQNPVDGSAWFNLGKTLSSQRTAATIDGNHYTQQQCFLKALHCDPRHTMAWNLLGDCFDHMVCGTTIDVNGTSDNVTWRLCAVIPKIHTPGTVWGSPWNLMEPFRWLVETTVPWTAIWRHCDVIRRTWSDGTISVKRGVPQWW